MIPVVMRVRAPWLSQLIGSCGESFWEPWMSFGNWINHFASLEASEQAMNSASKVDMAMRLRFRDCHEIAPLLARNTWPPWDLRSVLSLAQSESEYPMRLLLMSMPLKCSRKSAVDLKYWTTNVGYPAMQHDRAMQHLPAPTSGLL